MENQSTPLALPPSDSLRGALWMSGYSLGFGLSALAVKTVGTALPPAQIGFLRCLLGMMLLAPAFMRHGLGIYRTANLKLHIIRVFCNGTSVISSYYALAHLPFATAISLNFTRPLFMIIIAVALLHETVRWRRGLATLVGFGGVLIMLGPSRIGLDAGAAAGLLSAATVAGGMAVVRQQAAIDGPLPLFAWFTTGTTLITFFPALIGWQSPTPPQWGLLLFIGLASAAGQYCMIRAFAVAEATVVNPIDYSQIILAAVFGYFLFGEVPSLWTALGAVVIIASTLYILLREARIRKS